MSGELKHTPGPWEIDRFRGQPPYLITNRHDVICLFQQHERIRKKDIEANACLIAAAPDLLKACKKLYDTWHGFACPVCGADDEECKADCPWSAVVRAIAKAEEAK